MIYKLLENEFGIHLLAMMNVVLKVWLWINANKKEV